MLAWIHTRKSLEHAPEVHIRSQFALDEIIILHGCLVEGHCCLEKLILSGPMVYKTNPSSHRTQPSHTLNTSSAVLRTMNERGSDYDNIRHNPLGDEQSFSRFCIPLHLIRVECLDEAENTHRCPNPDSTFSRRLTASMKAGTFSGLETSNESC